MRNWLGLVMVADEDEEGDASTSTSTSNNSDITIRAVSKQPVTRTTSDVLLLSEWACGNHDDECDDDSSSRVIFANLTAVPPGSYQIRLKSYGYHGRTLQVESNIFRITDISCDVPVPWSTGTGTDRRQEDDFIQVLMANEQQKRHFIINADKETVLEVAFERSQPQPNDAIGIYPAHLTLEDIAFIPPLHWMWTRCAGSRDDDSCDLDRHGSPKDDNQDDDSHIAVPHGSVRFLLSSSSQSLPSGHYQAVLGSMIATTKPIVLLDPVATSAPFSLVDTTALFASPTSTSTSTTGSNAKYLMDPYDDNHRCDDEDTPSGRRRDAISVQTDQSCYQVGDDIPVAFSVSNPCHDETTTGNAIDNNSMIAIYQATADFTLHQGTSLRPPRPRLWLYTCGSQDCLEDVNMSTNVEEQEKLDDDDAIRMATSSLDDDPEWPLSVGTYKTVLIRKYRSKRDTNMSYIYHYFESEPFQIVEMPCRHSLDDENQDADPPAPPQQRRFLRGQRNPEFLLFRRR
jgi:hypothetical protein